MAGRIASPMTKPVITTREPALRVLPFDPGFPLYSTTIDMLHRRAKKDDNLDAQIEEKWGKDMCFRTGKSISRKEASFSSPAPTASSDSSSMQGPSKQGIDRPIHFYRKYCIYLKPEKEIKSPELGSARSRSRDGETKGRKKERKKDKQGKETIRDGQGP